MSISVSCIRICFLDENIDILDLASFWSSLDYAFKL